MEIVARIATEVFLALVALFGAILLYWSGYIVMVLAIVLCGKWERR